MPSRCPPLLPHPIFSVKVSVGRTAWRTRKIEFDTSRLTALQIAFSQRGFEEREGGRFVEQVRDDWRGVDFGKGVGISFAYFGIDSLSRGIYHHAGHSTRDFEIGPLRKKIAFGFRLVPFAFSSCSRFNFTSSKIIPVLKKSNIFTIGTAQGPSPTVCRGDPNHPQRRPLRFVGATPCGRPLMYGRV